MTRAIGWRGAKMGHDGMVSKPEVAHHPGPHCVINDIVAESVGTDNTCGTPF